MQSTFPQTSDKTPVTVIGLGMMGQALAGAFLAGGHPTTVWNRSAGKADELVGRGARAAGTIEAAVQASPLVIVCIRDYDTVRAALAPATGALPGRVLVNLTSGSSQDAHELAGWAAGHGAAYLDGAIMMTPPAIGGPETAIFYGGPRAVYDEHAETLAVSCRTPLVGSPAWRPSCRSWPARSTTARSWPPTPPFRPSCRRSTTWCTRAGPAAWTTGCPRSRRELIERAIADGHALDSYSRIIDQFRPPG